MPPVLSDLAEVPAVGEIDEGGPRAVHELRDARRALVGARCQVGCEGPDQGVVVVAGSELRYPFPGYDHHALIGTFAPDLASRTDQGATSVAELMHGARPTFIDLADRRDLGEIAQDWRHRVAIHTAETDHRPADALLIRPDAHVTWAATIDEPTDTPRRRCGTRSPAGSARLRAEASLQPSSSSRRLPAIQRSFRTISGISPSSRSRCSSGRATARTSDVARTVAVRAAIDQGRSRRRPGPARATQPARRPAARRPCRSPARRACRQSPPRSISGSPSCSSTSTSQPASWPRS